MFAQRLVGGGLLAFEVGEGVADPGRLDAVAWRAGPQGEGLGESNNDANQWIIRGAGGDDDIRGGC